MGGPVVRQPVVRLERVIRVDGRLLVEPGTVGGLPVDRHFGGRVEGMRVRDGAR